MRFKAAGAQATESQNILGKRPLGDYSISSVNWMPLTLFLCQQFTVTRLYLANKPPSVQWIVVTWLEKVNL